MATLTLSERIDRAKNGRSQVWLIGEMKKKGVTLSDVQFSRKKKGNSDFTKRELRVLSNILETELNY